jgi:hypothetical protein
MRNTIHIVHVHGKRRCYTKEKRVHFLHFCNFSSHHLHICTLPGLQNSQKQPHNLLSENSLTTQRLFFGTLIAKLFQESQSVHYKTGLIITDFNTIYGQLHGAEFRTLFSNGKTDGCLVKEKNLLNTPYGDLVPQYETEDMGRRQHKPFYFYKNGTIKSVPLQSQTLIRTPVGGISAELVTFYESGNLKRVFPLDGKLSGFWTARNEFALAEEITISSPLGSIRSKFIALQFYESGALKSLTLWPGEFLSLTTPAGLIRIRTGIAFHEDGAIRLLEPAGVVRVETPVGTLTAYDNEPQGIHGDLNSLEFTPEGEIMALKTVSEEITVIDQLGNPHHFSPWLKDNPCGAERKVVVPMKVRFSKGRIIFEDRQESFNMEQCCVEVRPFDRKASDPSYSCAV